MNALPLTQAQRSFVEYETEDPSEKVRRMYVCGNAYLDEQGSFDAQAMERAYFEVLRRNDAFRIRIFREGKDYRQEFLPVEAMAKPRRVELEDGNALRDYCNRAEPPAISVLAPALTEAEICVCRDGTGGLILWQQHACTDGWSMDQIFYRQLLQCYDAYRAGQEPEAPKRLFSYQKCVEAELNAKPDRRRRDLCWQWKEYNRHILRYSLPYRRYPPKKEQAFHTVLLPVKKWEALDAFCKELSCSATSALGLLAAMVGAKQFGLKRFPVYNITHGRSTFALKQTAGPLHDVHPIFFEYAPSCTVEECLQEQQRQTIDQMSHLSFGYRTEFLYLQNFINLLHGYFLAPHDWLFVNNMVDTSGAEPHSLRSQVMDKDADYSCFALLASNDHDAVRLDLQYNASLITKEQAAALEKAFLCAWDFMVNHPKENLKNWMDAIPKV